MNKINKKFCVILVLIMAICTACSTNSSSSDAGPTDKDYMETCYHYLCKSAEKLEIVSGAIHDAWHYGIFEDDYSAIGLAEEVGLSYSSFTADEISILNTSESFSDCVWAVIYAMEREGYYSDISNMLDTAKEKLREVSEGSEEYEQLKDFYSSCVSYYEWVQDPTGSFDEYGVTMETYNAELKKFKNKLSINLG